MDILHHAAVGFAGSMALAASGHPLASALFLGASILPDIDAAFIMRSKRTYLKVHQTFTHSIPVAAGAALASGLAGSWVLGTEQGLVAGFAVFFSLLIHILLDVSNTLGTKIFWPWGPRIRMDAAFFVDVLSWLLTISAIGALTFSGAAWPFFAYILAMSAQLLARFYLSRRSKQETGYPIAIPDPVIPWRYTMTKIKADGSAALARWSLFSGVKDEGRTRPPSYEAIQLAEQSQAVADMSGFARALAITDEIQNEDQHTVILRDLAMRRLGASYGQITITKEGKNISEQIKI